MGLKNWLSKTFSNSKLTTQNGETVIVGSTPILSDFTGTVYASDFVNNCIDRIAAELSKLSVKSIVESEGVRVANDDITRLFRTRPNEFQTTADFIATIEWQRRKNMNCFIYPKYDWMETSQGEVKRFRAFYVLNPTSIEVGICEGFTEIKFYFPDGSHFILPYSELIHMKWRRGLHMILGGDDQGQANTEDLRHSVDALHKTVESLPKTIEASLQISGVYAAKSMMGSDELNKARGDFESHIFKSKSGIIALDLGGEFTPVQLDYAKIEPETLGFLKSVICNRFGVSMAILSGDYTADQHAAFYQTVIEDFINQFEQAFTDYCFTPREKDLGHKIRCYYKKLQRLGTADIIQIATLATNTGMMTVDEIRDMLGQEPLPNGEGKKRIQSLNYVDAEKANSYQLAGKKGEEQNGET